VEENLAAQAVQLTDDQPARLDELTPPAGDHHKEMEMASTCR
jgi:hypothetical protein